MKANNKAQLGLVAIGIILILATYFLYPKLNESKIILQNRFK